MNTGDPARWRQSFRSGVLNRAYTEATTAWVQGYMQGAANLALLLADDAPAEFRGILEWGQAATAQLRRADDIPKVLDEYCAATTDAMVQTMTIGFLQHAYRR